MHSENVQKPLLTLLNNEQKNRMMRSWNKVSDLKMDCYDNFNSFFRAIELRPTLLVLINWDTQKTDESAAHLARVKAAVNDQTRLVVLADSNPEKDVVTALQTGADRFITTGYSVKIIDELIKAVLRRVNPEQGLQVFPPYCINQMTREVLFAGHRIRLTPQEFRIAQYLFENNDQILSREALLRDIWELPNLEFPRRVDTKMSHVRRKICLDGSHGWELQFPRGRGYKLINHAEINLATC